MLFMGVVTFDCRKKFAPADRKSVPVGGEENEEYRGRLPTREKSYGRLEKRTPFMLRQVGCGERSEPHHSRCIGAVGGVNLTV
jgi:hypothetical protein